VTTTALEVDPADRRCCDAWIVTATDDVQRAANTVFRMESAKLIAGLTRMVRDVGRAEELAQDALVAALEHWPREGIPDNPGAWLMATAKRRAIDELRRHKLYDRKHKEIGRTLDEESGRGAAEIEAAADDDVGDDLLRLIFTSCHPLLSTEARVALTLRLLGGLTTDEIARAFLIPEPTVAQRIVRAKKTLADARVPFEVPRGPELGARLASVLEVIYLVFNEGYSATAGDDWMRPGLCEDALRLGRVLAELAPAEPEVHGLVALMEIQASRTAARTGPDGQPILLADQNRAVWDQMLIRRGLTALARAEALGGAEGAYALQAAIAACHARARSAAETDWPRIVALYERLVRRVPSPVVELNRAVAVAMASGPAAGLALVDGLVREPALKSYYLLPGVRGDLLVKLGRFQEAAADLERAAALTKNAREQALLRERAATARRSSLAAASGDTMITSMAHTATAEITIRAPRARVWEALTKPELVAQYFFGTNVVTTWKIGEPILFRGEWEGKPYEDRGTVLAFAPDRSLSFNYWSAFSGLEDKPELRQVIRYDLSEAGTETRVIVTQSNVDTQERAEHSAKNWQTVLTGLKKLLES
jgi:RNA polymerase sigma-70 factor (ECF subfamily)